MTQDESNPLSVGALQKSNRLVMLWYHGSTSIQWLRTLNVMISNKMFIDQLVFEFLYEVDRISYKWSQMTTGSSLRIACVQVFRPGLWLCALGRHLKLFGELQVKGTVVLIQSLVAIFIWVPKQNIQRNVCVLCLASRTHTQRRKQKLRCRVMRMMRCARWVFTASRPGDMHGRSKKSERELLRSWGNTSEGSRTWNQRRTNPKSRRKAVTA